MSQLFFKQKSVGEFPPTPKVVEPFLSVIFAIEWQQVIKRIPLNTAFSTRSLGIIWGVLWGIIFFEEKLSPMMIAGSLIIILGIVLVVYADE